MAIQNMSDTELARQPAAYWTRLAYESIIAFTRAQQDERGYTQPQFWLLRHLSDNDISTDGRGMTVAELREAMTEYIRAEDDLEVESEVLLRRGWLRRDDDGRLWLTAAGEEARVAMTQAAPAIRALIHEGIDDTDYVTALRVLQRMIQNTAVPAP
jgi:hypothetical protein